MKLCKYCKHSIESTVIVSWVRCSKSLRAVDVVTGEQLFNFCSYARLDPHWLSLLRGSCGKQGRLFEKKS